MNTRLVYSTEGGRTCPQCRQALTDCCCAALAAQQRPPGDGVARVSREKAGRGGKTVTVVRGLPLTGAELQVLGRQLRAACGSGGTARDGVIEIQGEHRDRVAALLQQQGHRVKIAGG